MKTPPFLLGATLIFWGWQTNFLAVGALMAVIIESPRYLRARWDFSEDDFSRIWALCAVLFLAAFAYAFTSNQGVSGFRSFFNNPSPSTTRVAGNISARTAANFICWLPMLFFLFVIAQAFSVRGDIPLTSVSFIVRRLRRKLKKSQSLPPPQRVNVTYVYFFICLIAASIQASDQSRYFFWSLCGLLGWALWPQRSRWFSPVTWLAALALALVLGFGGQFGIRQIQRLLTNYNPQWLSENSRRNVDPLQTRTHIGQLGKQKLSGNILIRVEPRNGSRAPLYLREASYRIFKSSIWGGTSSREDSVWTANTSREIFEPLAQDRDSAVWTLVAGKTNIATNTISCYLEEYNSKDGFHQGLLPLPSGSGRLENLQAYGIRVNTTGAIMAQGPGLVIFDACHGPGATIDSRPRTLDTENVPETELPALNQVIEELQLHGEDTDHILLKISGFFNDKFSYTTWDKQLKLAPLKATPLSIFLLKTRTGHCEYFATATVLLLRQLGIPARYAVGYAVHEPSGNGYVVRGRDAHAWCLVWRNGTWEDFDTTPSSWSAEEAKGHSWFQPLSDGWGRLVFELSKFRWGHAHLQQYLLLTAVPLLGFLVYQIIFRRTWRRHRNPDTNRVSVAWPGLDSEFYQLEKWLTAHGTPRRPDEPLSDWLARALQNPALASLRGTLHSLLRLHYRLRFDPQGLAAATREELRAGVGACLRLLAQAKV